MVYENRDMGMVEGPLTGANVLRPICPGPLVGIAETDKIRAIYDGLKGGVNTYIYTNI